MSEIKLLPCPFCGGEAMECKTKIICKDCTCTVYGVNLEVARKIWNTRKPMERIIEKLGKLPYADDDGFVWLEDASDIVKEEGGIE